MFADMHLYIDNLVSVTRCTAVLCPATRAPLPCSLSQGPEVNRAALRRPARLVMVAVDGVRGAAPIAGHLHACGCQRARLPRVGECGTGPRHSQWLRAAYQRPCLWAGRAGGKDEAAAHAALHGRLL